VQTLLNQGKISETISLATLDAFREARALTNRLDQHEIDWLIRIGAFQPGIRVQGEQLLTAIGTTLHNNLADDNARQAIAKHCLGSRLSGAALLHAAFFLGSKDFYRWLHELDDSERELFQMTGVGQINELYNYDLPNGEARDRAQRLRARFINSTMKVSLTGAAISDGLANQQVVSGVGGQYNFVAMAHALADSRSIIMLRATRHTAKGVVSNIVWQYPYETIPRHLRDIVITEYGVADLRGKCDEDCVKAMLCIADSRFQAKLLKQAQQHNKLDPNWQVPAVYCNNTPAMLAKGLQDYRREGLFIDFPFGCDFSEQELQLVDALRWLKSHGATRRARLMLVARTLRRKTTATEQPLLELMQLHNTVSFAQWLNKKLLVLALQTTAQKDQ
ncbi:MAG: acetyl-CoA hydrolase, partial [Pseudomonadales bacterium]|nr:acetyl-CoA hydrolase [Pseudomonadales bacterium]